MKYLCPSCGALNEEGADYCTGCGIPLKADEARLKEEIERRLRGGEPSAPETAVLRPLPFLAAPDEPGRPAEGAPSAEIVLSKSPLKRKRRWWLLFGGLAAAAVIAAAAALSFFFADSEYTSSPEGVLKGLEKAINTQDTDLFWELVEMPYNTNKEDFYLSWMNNNAVAEFQVLDIMEGSRSNMAFAYVNMKIQWPDYYGGVWDSREPETETIVFFIKKDGQWKMSYEIGGGFYALL
ncbi:MAG TPA: hypothetical protein H9684_05115 [Firmicutes bacterium]|nr:hypothetical protein [Bacillota bacterium]